MSTTSGLSAAQLQAKIDALKAQGKTESTSKEVGKYVDALKVLNVSGKYGTETIAAAKEHLASSTQPGLAGASGSAGAVSTGTNPLTDLQAQLKAKQDALVKATSNLNDNPWYSEATRVGKLAKLNNIAQLEIGNIQEQIGQQQTAQQNAQSQSNWEREFALRQQAASTTTAAAQAKTSGASTATTKTGVTTTKAPTATQTLQSDSSQMISALNSIKAQTAEMGVSFEGGGSYITINQARPLIEAWVAKGHTESDWWSRFGSNVFGGKPK